MESEAPQARLSALAVCIVWRLARSALAAGVSAQVQQAFVSNNFLDHARAELRCTGRCNLGAERKLVQALVPQSNKPSNATCPAAFDVPLSSATAGSQGFHVPSSSHTAELCGVLLGLATRCTAEMNSCLILVYLPATDLRVGR